MKNVTVFCQSIEVSLRVGPDMCDITPALEGLIRQSGIENGVLFAAVVGSTCPPTELPCGPTCAAGRPLLLADCAANSKMR